VTHLAFDDSTVFTVPPFGLVTLWELGTITALGIAVGALAATSSLAPGLSSVARAQSGSLRAEILKIPGVGMGSPTDADWQKVGELCLGGLTNPERVADYGLALRIAGLLQFVSFAVNAIVAPRFAVLYAEGRLAELARLLRRAVAVSGLAILPAGLLVWEPGLVLWLFPEATASGLPLSILAAGYAVWLVTGSANAVLIMTGRARWLWAALGVAALLSLALNLWLIPAQGAVGSAIAHAVAMPASGLLAVVAIYWKLGVVALPIPGANRLDRV